MGVFETGCLRVIKKLKRRWIIKIQQGPTTEFGREVSAGELVLLGIQLQGGAKSIQALRLVDARRSLADAIQSGAVPAEVIENLYRLTWKIEGPDEIDQLRGYFDGLV